MVRWSILHYIVNSDLKYNTLFQLKFNFQSKHFEFQRKINKDSIISCTFDNNVIVCQVTCFFYKWKYNIHIIEKLPTWCRFPFWDNKVPLAWSCLILWIVIATLTGGGTNQLKSWPQNWVNKSMASVLEHQNLELDLLKCVL